MKNLFKTTRVVYDAHLKEYQVYYKNWFVWKYDTCYKYDENEPGKRYGPIHYCTKEEAEQRAIERAKAMLDTVEIWKQSNISYYI